MNLTESILQAKSYMSDEVSGLVISTLITFSIKNNFKIDWDKDDGEQWGRLFNNDILIAIFSAKLPLVFMVKDFYEKGFQYFENIDLKKVVLIKVCSWNTQNNSIDISKISDVIQWNSTLSSESKFSLNDFWFATI